MGVTVANWFLQSSARALDVSKTVPKIGDTLLGSCHRLPRVKVTWGGEDKP